MSLRKHNKPQPLTEKQVKILRWLDNRPELFTEDEWDEFSTLMQYIDFSNTPKVPVKFHDLLTRYEIQYDQFQIAEKPRWRMIK